MALIKRCCCCSLETGTKLIGFMQFIVGLIAVIVVVVELILVLYVRDLVIKEAANNDGEDTEMLIIGNGTDIESTSISEEDRLNHEEREASAKVAYAYVIIALILLLLYLLFSTLTGALLLVGVYKGKLNYVKWWIRIKTGLVLLAVGFILLQLLLLLFGLDADLTKSIISLVYDSCLILVVNSYYDEESDKTCDSDLMGGDGFNNALPPPAYC